MAVKRMALDICLSMVNWWIVQWFNPSNPFEEFVQILWRLSIPKSNSPSKWWLSIRLRNCLFFSNLQNRLKRLRHCPPTQSLISNNSHEYNTSNTWLETMILSSSKLNWMAWNIQFNFKDRTKLIIFCQPQKIIGVQTIKELGNLIRFWRSKSGEEIGRSKTKNYDS